jgi:hypothetical protein
MVPEGNEHEGKRARTGNMVDLVLADPLAQPRTRRIALARVSGSYFFGMRCTFPTKEVCIKPGMVHTGPGGHCGASQESSAVDLPPHIDTSDQPLPGPAKPTLQPAKGTRKTTAKKSLRRVS